MFPAVAVRAGVGPFAPAGLPEVAKPVEVDLSGLRSVDEEGSAHNSVIEVDLAAPGLHRVVPAGRDVTLDAVGAGRASVVTLGIGDAAGASACFLMPGIGIDEPLAGGMFCTDVNGDDLFDLNDDLVDLGSVGLDPVIATSGTLRIGIFECFDDRLGETNATFGAGSTLYLRAIPGPGAPARLGLAGRTGSR